MLTYCCILAVGAATAAFAQDNSAAQQKALDALRQFTAEKEGKTTKPLTTKPKDDAIAKELEQKAREQAGKAPAATQAPAAKPVAAPVVTKAATTTTTKSQGIETEQERKAREALDALRRGASEPQPKALTATTTAAPVSNVSKEDAARAALAASYAKPAPAAETVAPKAAASMATTKKAATTTTAAPMAVMSQPKPKTLKEKLNDLLELYMDNSITPRQYHDQRAALVAGN